MTLKGESAVGWLSAIMIVVVVSVPAVIGQCYTQNQNAYRMYGSKTSYSDVVPQTQPNDQTSVCRPTFIYLLAREGTRFPAQQAMQYMAQYLDESRNRMSQGQGGQLCPQDAARLRAWRMPFQPADAEKIAEAGFAEMFQLGKRLQSRFPQLLQPRFNPNQVHIQHTYLTRSRDSARGFVSALYQTYNVTMRVNPRGNDPLLRFPEICTNYIQTVGKQRVPAYDQFINGPVFTQIANAIAARLGIPGNAFTKEHMKIAWDACRYEHSILKNAPWCAAFTTQQLKALEYAVDMKDFYKLGHGNKINADMTCALMKDIVLNLKSATVGRQTRQAVLRFGHADTLQPLFARLGLFRDQTPPVGTQWQANSNRQWRTSRISAFASNIALMSYDCSGTPHIRVLVNERPVIMPGCTDQLCPIATAMRTVGQWAEQCNFQQICGGVGGRVPLNTNLFPNTPKQLGNQFGKQIGNQLGNQFGKQIGNQLGNKLGPPEGAAFGVAVGMNQNQLGKQIGNQLGKKSGPPEGAAFGVGVGMNRYGSQMGVGMNQMNRYGSQMGAGMNPMNRYGSQMGAGMNPMNRFGSQMGMGMNQYPNSNPMMSGMTNPMMGGMMGMNNPYGYDPYDDSGSGLTYNILAICIPTLLIMWL